MKNLFFDIETSGLIPKGLEWSTDYKLFPHIVSIAWKVVTPISGKGYKTQGQAKEFLIFQEGREIPIEVIAIHGITTAQGNDPYITHPIKKVLEQFMYDGLSVDKMIAHNCYFDSAIIKANVLREFGPESKEATSIKVILDKDRRVDTMRMGQPYMKNGKWPKLSELYKKLFDEEFAGHNASVDVEACERCYYEMVKRKPELVS